MGLEDLRPKHDPITSEGNLYTPQQSFVDSRDAVIAHPTAVVQSTYSLLDQYYYHRPTDTTPIFSFLRDYSLPFLEAGKKAIPVKFPRLLPQSHSDMAIVKRVLDSDYSSDPEIGLSNLDVIGTIFAVLPDKVTIPVLKDGFSREGLLRPPQTITEMYTRITEMQRTIASIMKGVRVREGRLNLNSANFRTFAFLKVGSEYGLKEGRTQNEVDQERQYHTDRVARQILGERDPVADRELEYLNKREAFERMLGWFDLPEEI